MAQDFSFYDQVKIILDSSNKQHSSGIFLDDKWLRYLTYHGLIMPFRHLLDIGGDSQYIKFKEVVNAQTIKNIKLVEISKKITQALDQQNIPYCFLKGPALSYKIYGDTISRTSHDIDLWVPSDRMKEVSLVLQKLGAVKQKMMQNKFMQNMSKHQAPYAINGVLIEPHDRNIWLNQTDQSFEEIMMEGLPVKYPNMVQNIYYLCMHAYDHIYQGKMRLMWLLDIAMLIKRADNKTWYKVMNDSKVLDMLKLIHQEFVPLPVKVRAHYTDSQLVDRFYHSIEPGTEHQVSDDYHVQRISNLNLGQRILYYLSIFFPSNIYLRSRYGVSGIRLILMRFKHPFLIIMKKIR